MNKTYHLKDYEKAFFVLMRMTMENQLDKVLLHIDWQLHPIVI
jgi:hypothetical protein